MRREEVREELRKLMMNPKTTVKQLRELAKKSNWHLYWGMKRPQPALHANLSTLNVEEIRE